MSLVFLQALVADIVHVDRVQHAYCPTHQEITHDVAHVQAIRATQLARISHSQASIERAEIASSDHAFSHAPQNSKNPHAPRNRDHKDSPFDCGELIWLAADTEAVFFPEFGFTLPLPLLAGRPDAKSVQLQRDSFPAIALHFHASGLSPPVLS